MDDATMHLDQGQLRRLRDLDMSILVPGSVPADLREIHVTADRGEGPSYRVVFQASPQRWVALEGACTGLGDVMPGKRSESFRTAEAGVGEIEFYGPDSEERVDFRSWWIQPSPEGPAYALSGKGLDRGEVLHVAASLHWLR